MATEARETTQGTGAETLADMVLAAAEHYEGAALRFKEGDEWQDISYGELRDTAREIAGGLIALGIEPKERVAILSDTRPEWTLADLGAILAGTVVVPIYQTASAEEARHVLQDSESKLVFCENEDQLDTAREAAEGLDHVEHFVLCEGEADGAMTLDELRRRGEENQGEIEQRVEGISRDDVFTLIYTSGTTGPPKGCVLTHGNYRPTCEMLEEVVQLEGDSVFFIFLPLAHALSRMTQMAVIDIGGTLAYWQRDKEKAMDDMRDVQPTHVPAVPRIFEKIYEEARKQADGAVKEKIFDKAVDVGRQVRELERKGEAPGFLLKKEYDLADKQVLSKVRSLFGDNLEFAMTGAAPVAKEMLEFFDACGVLILEGYGATETSAVAAANSPDDFRFGTVGKAVPGSEIKIADDKDDEGRGEILVKGPHVFQGYYQLDDETNDSFDGDWFKTGDLGSLDDDGYLTVTGRTKEIIVTSSGKNITPTNVESKIADGDGISQVVVYGDDRPYLVALVEVDDDSPDPDDSGLRDKVQKAVDSANSDLAKIEQVKKFAILDRPLSQEEGELTPTMKVKREKVYENFSEQIDSLYENGDGGGDSGGDGDQDEEED
jgi:long-chain acyl-CoA synthetase